jgi:TM2 domain-containing membrane protein YozV
MTGSSQVAGYVFLGVASLAMIGLAARNRHLRVYLILPQQLILWFSVVGAAHAMYLGQFADGIQRAHWFLVVDQVPIVLIALGHTVALLFIASDQAHG